MPANFVDISPDSSNRLFHYRLSGVPHVGTGEKRLWGGRPRPEPCHPTTFFRLSRRHPPLPYSLPFMRSCSYRSRSKNRCPRAVYRLGPTAAKPPPSDRRHSGLLSPTDINPLRPRNSGAHVPCLPKKSFFLMFPLCKWGAIGKNDNGYPLALCCLCGSCRACTTINRYPLAP